MTLVPRPQPSPPWVLDARRPSAALLGALTWVPRPPTWELPAYLVASASCTGFNRADMSEYTEGILKWWRFNNPQFPGWAKAARIIFAMLPSSAPSERVFSLVEGMFGSDQLNVLGDQLQGSVMLRYNKRAIG